MDKFLKDLDRFLLNISTSNDFYYSFLSSTELPSTYIIDFKKEYKKYSDCERGFIHNAGFSEKVSELKQGKMTLEEIVTEEFVEDEFIDDDEKKVFEEMDEEIDSYEDDSISSLDKNFSDSFLDSSEEYKLKFDSFPYLAGKIEERIYDSIYSNHRTRDNVSSLINIKSLDEIVSKRNPLTEEQKRKEIEKNMKRDGKFFYISTDSSSEMNIRLIEKMAPFLNFESVFEVNSEFLALSIDYNKRNFKNSQDYNDLSYKNFKGILDDVFNDQKELGEIFDISLTEYISDNARMIGAVFENRSKKDSYARYSLPLMVFAPGKNDLADNYMITMQQDILDNLEIKGRFDVNTMFSSFFYPKNPDEEKNLKKFY